MKLYFGLLLGILLVAGCSSVGDKKMGLIEKPTCEVRTNKAEPIWVHGHMIIPGFYSGIGSMPISGNGDELVLATQRATADLANSIQTSVSRVVTSKTREQRQNGVILSQSDNAIITKSVTRLSLNNVTRVDKWQDGESCRLWVLVRVDEATVQKNLDRHQSEMLLSDAERLYESTANIDESLSRRIQGMEQAMAMLDDIKFELLPTQKRRFYQAPYHKRLSTLKTQVKNRQTLIFINSANEQAAGLESKLADALSTLTRGHWLKQREDCKLFHICLNIARDERAKNLVIVSFGASNRNGNMGSTIGMLDVDIGVYDVRSGEVVSIANNAKGEVFSFDNQVDWEIAIKRVFEEASVKQALSLFSRCTVAAC